MAIREEIESHLIETDVVVSTTVICNKCGRETSDEMERYEYFHVDEPGGYNNWVIGDQCVVEFDLCQYCLAELIDSLIIPPDASSWGRETSWEELKAKRPDWRC